MRRQLTEEQVREVLTRAEQIHLGEDLSADSILKAAEESGLPREAIEQALRERFEHLEAPPQVGDIVFARSGDGNYYIAKVQKAEGDRVGVEFLAGGRKELRLEDLIAASFTPGQRFTVDWPGWGWAAGRLLSYNAKSQKVTMQGWAEQKTLPLKSIRLDGNRAGSTRGQAMAIWIGGMISGGVLGAVLTWLLMR